MTLRIAALKGHVAPDDITSLRQTLVERSHAAVNRSFKLVKPADDRDRRLLRLRRQWPRGCASDQSDKFAPLHGGLRAEEIPSVRAGRLARATGYGDGSRTRIVAAAHGRSWGESRLHLEIGT